MTENLKGSTQQETRESLAALLRQRIDERRYIDVGAGAEKVLGVSRTKLDWAINYLVENHGCKVYYVKAVRSAKYAASNRMTAFKVFGGADSSFVEVCTNPNLIQPL